MLRPALRTLIGATLVLALVGTPATARATLVERIIAVVGEHVILLSDLRERAHPFLLQIYQGVPAGAQRSAAISQLYKGLIEKLVDEELEQRAAVQAKVSVTAREVEEALERVAQQNGVTSAKLLSEARRSGLDEADYRDELRRQLLQTKLINVRLQGRIRVTEDDLRAYYRKLALEEREKLGFRAAWILLDASGDAAGRKSAEGVARLARAGGDFSDLARRFSKDPATRGSGGVIGATKPEQLPPALKRVLSSLEVGETSGVVALPGAFAIVKLLSRDESSLPTFEEAQNELSQRVYLEKMTQARRTWLDNLRRQQHVEVRL